MWVGVCFIYKAAVSSSEESGCMSGTDVGPEFIPSAGVSDGPKKSEKTCVTFFTIPNDRSI